MAEIWRDIFTRQLVLPYHHPTVLGRIPFLILWDSCKRKVALVLLGVWTTERVSEGTLTWLVEGAGWMSRAAVIIRNSRHVSVICATTLRGSWTLHSSSSSSADDRASSSHLLPSSDVIAPLAGSLTPLLSANTKPQDADTAPEHHTENGTRVLTDRQWNRRLCHDSTHAVYY